MPPFGSYGPPSRRTLTVLLAICLLVGAVTTASAAATYEMDVTNSIDGPEQEFTVEGETHRVSSLSYYAPGESIETSVTQSGDSSQYEVVLYNTDKRIEKSTTSRSGDGDVTFTTDGVPAGTYLLAVDDDGFHAVHPVVIQGYDVSVDTQSSVAAGESWTATATLDAYADAPSVHAVEFVLLGEDTEKRFGATETDAGSYEAEVTAPDGAGQYSFGVIVRGTTEVADGEHEPIAVSHPVTLDVQDGGADGGGDGSQGGAGAGGEGSQTTATPTNATATATPDASPTPTATDARSGDEPNPTETDDSEGSEGPVTPAETTGTTETTGSDDQVREESSFDEQAGFGAGAGLVALLATLALLARRR